MKKIIVCAALIFAVSPVFAQNLPAGQQDAPSTIKPLNAEPASQKAGYVNPRDYNCEVGLAAGFSSGVGLSGRYWNNNWGTQITACPIFESDTGTTFLSLGALRMYRVYANDFSIFYLYGGGAFFLMNSRKAEDDTGRRYVDLGKTANLYVNFGVGPGLELFVENVGINVMCGFALYNGKRFNSGTYTLDTQLTIEGGAYYRFNL